MKLVGILSLSQYHPGLALIIVIVLEIGLASSAILFRLIPTTIFFDVADYMGGLVQYLALALATIWSRKSSS